MAESKLRVLVVDDEEQMRRAMETVLARLGHVIWHAANGQEALELLETKEVDLVISDLRMPVLAGDVLLKKIKETYAQLPVVMITAYGTIDQAVDAMKNGAMDFITKPFSADDLERIVGRVAKQPAIQNVTAEPQGQIARDRHSLAIVTSDTGFRGVLEIAAAVSGSTASVLVQGESGTGKELIARYIHNASNRSGGPFVAVNCAALPDNLLESELFGHEKGSFTGAIGTKFGKFEQASNGTLLLDEISEMDLGLQAKLLRVLQEREIDRVGGTKPISVDVRIVATTNRNLRACVQEGKFREDLYYRLNVIPLFVPPLRERGGDIELLTEHFVRKFSVGKPKRITAELRRALNEHGWPGNVRELQNACERAVLLAVGEELSIEHFMLGALEPAGSAASNDGNELRAGLSVADAERKLIYETLRSTGNNKSRAAELLGISIRTLRNKLNEYERLP